MSTAPRAPTTAPDAALPRRLRRLIDRHFAGRLDPAAERALRATLPEHAAARAYYERHQLLARLDPRALTPEQRLARGLGLAPARPPARPLLLWGAASAAAAAGLVALLVGHGLPVATPDRDERAHTERAGAFSPRGAAATLPALEIFTVTAGTRSAPVSDSIAPGVELGFAYRNPRQWPYLLLFALDAERRVYWFYPAWTDPQANPAAVPIDKRPGLHELGEAIAHDFRGPTLALHALFSDRPLTVRAIEAALRREARAPEARLLLPRSEDHVTRLRLRR